MAFKSITLKAPGAILASWPLLLFGLGVVLVGAALLVFVFKEDTPLEQWLANGPFSTQPLDIPVMNAKNTVPLASMRSCLLVDDQGNLAGAAPGRHGRLRQENYAVYLMDNNGIPAKKIGDIGQPIQAEALKTPSALARRFGAHTPGDVDWGPPVGGEQVVTTYPCSRRKMIRWKEPDGSFVWITLDNILLDYKLVPDSDGRLFEKHNTLYLKTDSQTFVLGRRGRPIRNRENMKVDRKDKGQKMRNWCEKPETAYLSLAACLFSPTVALSFYRTARKNVKYPDNDLSKGYDYFARINVGLPHFIDGKSRLQVQMWEKFDLKPVLNYDHRIILSTDENGPLRRITLTWPLANLRSRYSKISVKVRIDLYGDGRLWLPLAADGGRSAGAAWTIVNEQADRRLMPRMKEKAAQ